MEPRDCTDATPPRARLPICSLNPAGGGEGGREAAAALTNDHQSADNSPLVSGGRYVGNVVKGCKKGSTTTERPDSRGEAIRMNLLVEHVLK